MKRRTERPIRQRALALWQPRPIPLPKETEHELVRLLSALLIQVASDPQDAVPGEEAEDERANHG